MTDKEFCERFVRHMILNAGFLQFDDGSLVADYAKEVAPTYYEQEWQRDEGPEACAEADISYWGGEAMNDLP